jgi:hypothetical protein
MASAQRRSLAVQNADAVRWRGPSREEDPNKGVLCPWGTETGQRALIDMSHRMRESVVPDDLCELIAVGREVERALERSEV